MFTAFFLIFSSAFPLTFSEPALETIWDSVVLIRSESVDDQSAQVPSYCNASLLSARLLVTAAHCVQHAEVLKQKEVEVWQGYYKDIVRPDGTRAHVGYVQRFKENRTAQFLFKPSVVQKIQSQGLKAKLGPDEDVAVILLKEPLSLPESPQFLKIATRAEVEALQSRVTHYWPTVITINFMEEMSSDTKRQALLEDLKFNGDRHWKSKSHSRLQAGDSGAPLAVRIGTSWKLIGLVKGRAETIFSNWDVYSRLDQNLCEMALGVGEIEKTLLCPLDDSREKLLVFGAESIKKP